MNEEYLTNVTNDSNDFKQQADEYRSIVENTSFYVIKTDLNGNYSYLNPFFCKKFGLESQEWIGRSSIDLIIPADHQVCRDTVMKCFEHPGHSYWVNLRKPYQNGMITTQWEFKALLDQTGQPEGILCIGHDITSLTNKVEELQELVALTAEQNEKLTNFTYIVSHNIRSHVANITGIIALNDAGYENDQDITWEIIKRSISGLDATIYNLNEIISIQRNIDLPIKKIFIKSEVERIIGTIHVLFTNASTRINDHLQDGDYLDTNPAYLESILLNLLTNALKYKSPDRSLEIDISLSREGNYNVLIFKDNGIGIDLNIYGDKIFGMYKTFHGNPDAKGLGLFIVKTQIEAMGGKITVESVPNQSTTFRTYFATTTETLHK